jgi:tol-pal system protein YbgF|tara:strand:- start:612 stop:1454 length:843 start_codon:yes stop_codon:yes gene_type:complete
MKKYFLVGLLLVSNYAFAIFEDEEARKKINEMQDQLNNIEKSLEFKINQKFSKNLSNYSSELNELHDTIAKLIGDIEVLQFELKNSEERNKVIYKELNERIVKLESRIEEQSQNKPNDSLVDTEKNLTKDNIDKQSEESQIQDNGLAPLVDINIELDAYSEADSLVKATRYKEAFKAFDKFITTYPNSELLPKAKYRLGYSQWALKNYNAAIKTYSKIIELHPNNEIIPDTIYGIANCEIQLTRITKAKKTLRNLIKKYPQSEIIQKAKKRLKALESIKL